jgi:DNA-binding beta-propeller fold protein YncE
MNTVIKVFVFSFLMVVTFEVSAQKLLKVLTVPGRDAYTNINKNGKTVLPSGRHVTPAGQTIQITHDPFGMAVSPDGSKTVTLHNGVITIIDNSTLNKIRVPSYDKSIVSPFSKGSFLGVAFSPDSKTVYLSGGDNGAVLIYDVEKFRRVDSISLNGNIAGVEYEDSFTSDLLLDNASKELLVLDRGNFRLVRINIETKKITASIKTGRQPFGLAVSPDRKTAFVANVGVYDYPLLTGLTPKNKDSVLLPFHPYADNSKEAIEGFEYKGQKIPGVGSPLASEAMSVYAINLATNKVTDKFKPGYQVGQMIEGAEVVGGASPNSIAVGSRYAYVSNATNDNISVIDYRNHKIVGHIAIEVNPLIDRYRGLLPFGICLSKDEKTLYVALLGFNAIAVIDVEKRITTGLIPTGWGPTRVQLSKDDKQLYVITCRGYGAGPNGGKDFVEPEQGTYIGDIQLGTFQKIPVPDMKQLKVYTKQSVDNTFVQVRVKDDLKNPVPLLPGLRDSPIKHIVYITKENRTYDELMGQLTTGSGDSTLARYGVRVSIDDKSGNLQNINVSPNHLKLANEFAFADNFYCDSDNIFKSPRQKISGIYRKH